METSKQYLTTKEVAELCNVVPRSVRNWVYLNKLPSVVFAGKMVFETKAVERFLEKHTIRHNGGF